MEVFLNAFRGAALQEAVNLSVFGSVWRKARVHLH